MVWIVLYIVLGILVGTTYVVDAMKHKSANLDDNDIVIVLFILLLWPCVVAAWIMIRLAKLWIAWRK